MLIIDEYNTSKMRALCFQFAILVAWRSSESALRVAVSLTIMVSVFLMLSSILLVAVQLWISLAACWSRSLSGILIALNDVYARMSSAYLRSLISFGMFLLMSAMNRMNRGRAEYAALDDAGFDWHPLSGTVSRADPLSATGEVLSDP